MKPWLLLAVLLIILVDGCRRAPTPADAFSKRAAPAVLHDLPPQVRAFVERKERDLEVLARNLEAPLDETTRDYMRLARHGEYRNATRIYQNLRERGGKVASRAYEPGLRLPFWDPLLEVQLTLDAYAAGAGRFATEFGEGVARDLPRGSIYFGGTDPGRGLVAAFSRPRDGEESYFVLTQNQLADSQHLAYLRAAYGSQVHLPSDADVQQCFGSYLVDVQRRLEHDRQHPSEPRQLKPGETVSEDGRVQPGGQVAVMMINGQVVKFVFDHNPDRECFIEESFTVDWMYPHLTPHGWILKLQRDPLDAIPAEVIDRDRAFWRSRQTKLIGDWLTPQTSIRELCDFVERVHHRHSLRGFKGDREFILNDYATAVYSKLRVAQAGVYAWRMHGAASGDEQARMLREAGFAFRQAFAFGPTNPEVLLRFAHYLVAAGRADEALLLAQTVRRMRPRDTLFKDFERQLEQVSRP